MGPFLKQETEAQLTFNRIRRQPNPRSTIRNKAGGRTAHDIVKRRKAKPCRRCQGEESPLVTESLGRSQKCRHQVPQKAKVRQRARHGDCLKPCIKKRAVRPLLGPIYPLPPASCTSQTLQETYTCPGYGVIQQVNQGGSKRGTFRGPGNSKQNPHGKELPRPVMANL